MKIHNICKKQVIKRGIFSVHMSSILLEQGHLLNKKNANSGFTSLENETVSKKCLCEPVSDFPHRPKLLHIYNVRNPPNWQGFETTTFIFLQKISVEGRR